MVKHRGRDYCSDKCADDHYNNKRRLKLSYEKGGTTNTDEKNELSKPQPSEELINNNIAILNRLKIDGKKGSPFDIQYLDALGFNFKEFTGRGKLFNTKPMDHCYFLQIGQFRLHRIAFSHVLISKNKLL